MYVKHKILTFSCCILGLVSAQAARASTLWSQALPTSNVNTGTGQSNVSVNYGTMSNPNNGGTADPYILGDSFSFGQTNTINSVTVYMTTNAADPTTDTPGSEFSSVSLYVGADGTDLSQISSTYTPVLTTYSNLQDYHSYNNASTFPIYALTFSGLNLELGAGTYDYAIGATPNNVCGGGGTSKCVFSLLASDSSASTPAGDESGGFGFFLPDGSSGGPPIVTFGYCPPGGGCSPATLSGYTNPSQNIDVNVLITGQLNTPEPGTFAILALGLAGVFAARRRRS